MARRLRIDRLWRPEPAAPLRGFECLRCLKSQPHQSARQDETRRQLQACCFSGPPIRAGALELEIITVVVLRVYFGVEMQTRRWLRDHGAALPPDVRKAFGFPTRATS